MPVSKKPRKKVILNVRKPELGDGPIEAAHREAMQAVAKALDYEFNDDARGDDRKVGFVLLVFPYGESTDARCNYISNGADRHDIVALFKEQIKHFENQMLLAEPEQGHA